MKTKKKSNLINNNIILVLCVFAFLSTSLLQAQVKRDQRTKKTNTRDHRTNKAPKNDVATDGYRNDYLVTNPPRSTQEDLEKWNRIVTYMLGVEGFDPISNFINYPPSEKRIVGIPGTGSNNNWVPLSYKKQVCCGKLENFKTYDGFGDEMDWNFFVLPNDEFSFLITKALPYKKETTLMSSSGWHINKKNRDHRRGYEWKKYKLEAEVTPDQSLYDNPFFPKKGSKKVGDPDVVLEGKQMCFYGPWVREWNHHYRPEIHPSEMIWWRLNGGYYMMLIQDDSNRFDSKDDFDLDGLLPSNWKPWAEPPLTAQFRVAFEINPSASDLPYKMDVREVLKRFVVTIEDAGASADSDNGTSHTLVVDNKKLLIANELQENDNDLGVKFVDITKRADGTIQGYLQITTKVGGPDLGGDEGYHLIYVSSNIPVKKSDRANRIDHRID